MSGTEIAARELYSCCVLALETINMSGVNRLTVETFVYLRGRIDEFRATLDKCDIALDIIQERILGGDP